MKYVIIGSSAAGINAVRELRKYDQEGEIVLVSKDQNIYSRCILHQYLSGERTLERLNFAEPDFASLYRVNWMKGREAVGLRPADHILVLDGNEELSHQGSQKRCYKPTNPSVQIFQPRRKGCAVRTGMGCYLLICTWLQKACPSGTNCLSTGRRKTPDPPFLPSPRGG